MAIAAAIVLAVAVVLILIFTKNDGSDSGGNKQETGTETAAAVDTVWFCNTDASRESEIVVFDTVIDTVHLSILTPYNVSPELHVGPLDTSDHSIVFAFQAADLRRDNGKIVGAFVCASEPLSWGLSKKGYCAILGDSITVGVSDISVQLQTPVFRRRFLSGGRKRI